MPSARRLTQLVLFAVLAISVACKSNGVKPPEGDILAAIGALPTADEAPFDAQSLRGKPTLVLFASPTCHYCMAELPLAEKAAAAEKGNLVAVFIVGAKKHAASIKKSKQMTAPFLVDEEGALREKYGIKGVPFTVVLDANGKARTAFRGQQDEATLREALADAR
jgi:thiol-disulfide isomerase/thioredoxin